MYHSGNYLTPRIYNGGLNQCSLFCHLEWRPGKITRFTNFSQPAIISSFVVQIFGAWRNWRVYAASIAFRRHRQGILILSAGVLINIFLPSFLWAETLTWSKNRIGLSIMINAIFTKSWFISTSQLIQGGGQESDNSIDHFANRKTKELEYWFKEIALIKSRIRTQSKKGFSIDYPNALKVPQFSYNLHVLLGMKMTWLPRLMWLIAILSFSAHIYASVFRYYKWRRNLNRILTS